MTFEDFSKLFEEFRETAFRLETLPTYSVEEEEGEIKRFLAGEPLPTDPNAEWCERIRKAKHQGKVFERVRLLPMSLTPYVRYEIDWCYPFSLDAGEKIWMLTDEAPAAVRAAASEDFWMFDEEKVAVLRYDSDGHFEAVDEVDPASISHYTTLRDQVRLHSTPLREWLAKVRSS
jgi:hypothetical protein